MKKYSSDILKFLKEENVKVDSEKFDDLEWHFNRIVDLNNEGVDAAIADFKKVISRWQMIRDDIADPSAQSCQDALVIVGQLSHVWQDYYAHGIARTSDGSKGTIGRIEGNPDNIGPTIKPSSWGYLGYDVWNNDFGEHGSRDPAYRAPDLASRKLQAENFTWGKLEEFVKIWWEPCKCYAKDVIP